MGGTGSPTRSCGAAVMTTMEPPLSRIHMLYASVDISHGPVKLVSITAAVNKRSRLRVGHLRPAATRQL